MESDKAFIGKNIAYLRKQKGMTQTELANLLKVSHKAISKWETGRGCPDISFIPDIAKIFDVSIDLLFNGDIRS